MSDDKITSPAVLESPQVYDDEKKRDEISPVHDETATVIDGGDVGTPEMRRKIVEYYGRKAEEDEIAPRADVTMILDQVLAMSEDEAMEIVLHAIDYYQTDPLFPGPTMDKMKRLALGYKGADMEASDWAFDLKTEAAIIHYHSPYPEVRSVTDPFDDPDSPCETFRAYFLGLGFMAGVSALNTFFSPRQPAIGIGSNVLQLMLVPCGQFFAKVLPNWNFTVPAKIPWFGGSVWALNPGPWTYKEQNFATIIFTVASGAGGTYYVYLVQMLPQYLNQNWVTFGYEILLALSCQFFGFGFAGLLRRFVIFPPTAVWPKVLPTLALNRALLVPEKRETINGWRISRYKFFMIAFVAMFIWFWVPNTLLGAIRLFNWMTWIAPNNFTLAMITGSYGGMGFNPISTFDWNVAGSGALVTPWYSQIQQYFARVLSGLIIIGMYWGNYYWSAYTPINSNESFTNTGAIYNVSMVMGSDGYIDVEAYKAYGPPFFSGANVFGQGAWFAWYTLSLSYIFIHYGSFIWQNMKGMWHSIRTGASLYDGQDDPHTRMIKRYPEVPEWWFLVILAMSFAFGVAGLVAWPTHTPWWSLLTLIGMNLIFLLPAAILIAKANIGLNTGVLFQLLAGVWFAGNPEAQIIMQAFGSNFQGQADNYISDQKIAHYVKIPPRAIFRAQTLSTFLNAFIFIGMLNWMVNNFSGGGTLCTWDNPQHFVCTDAVLFYASAVQYGAFGVKNFFKLYPILPWCFLMGILIGTAWGCTQKYGPLFRERAYRTWSERRYAFWDKWLFRPIALLTWVDPAVCWAGALNWTGGNNLTYATGAVYLSFIFMYHIKRRYQAWWEKYNYLLEAGFDVGVAVSATIQTLILNFPNNGNGFPNNPLSTYSGNTIGQRGWDWWSYNQYPNATLLPIPEVGYFGPAPEDYPMSW